MKYKDKYKYWFFYIKPEYLHLVCTEADNSLLYAYTDNKEYFEIFKSQRDMNKFFMMKKDINREEVNHLAKNFSREYLLKKEIKTKLKGIGSEIIYYNLIMTKTEENMIQSISSKALLIDIWKCAQVNPYIFEDNYMEMLDVIGFKQKFDLMNNYDTKKNKDTDNLSIDCYPDLLSTFIREYGFLLSLKK